MSEANSITDPPKAPEPASPPSPTPSVAGVDRFAHFVVSRRKDGELDRLGAGGMGVTYRAFDTQLERLVALKVIHAHYMEDDEIRRRFAREARAAARLQHPNIAGVLYHGEECGSSFYAMELVAGEDLHEYIDRVGPIGPVHALRLTHQIASALVAASREGIIHRDLKPSNVMLTSYLDGAPHLKVIDFGLAKISTDNHTTLVTGGFLGTPEFSSPEQCEEKPVDERSDLYSLGAILWYLLTGNAPFRGSMLSVMKAQVSVEPDWKLLAQAPAPVLDLLHRLLAKDREQRPQNAGAAVREIEDAISRLAGERKNFEPLIAAPLKPKLPNANLSWETHDLDSHKAGTAVFEPTQRIEKIPTKSRDWRKPAGIAAGLLVFAAAVSWPLLRKPAAPAQANIAPAAPVASASTQPAVKKPVGPAPDAKEFTNGLGMKFVRMPQSDMFIAVWETRVQDFAAFAADPSAKLAGGSNPAEPSWRHPGFPQTDDHPVVFVSAAEATAFCEWLTQRERKAGLLPADQEYRLPVRPEWDEAVTGHTPQGQRQRPGPPDFQAGPEPSGPPEGGPAEDAFPEGGQRPGPEFTGAPPPPPPGALPFLWGTRAWPPPSKFGNFSAKAYGDGNLPADAGDGFAYTAPVGSFAANRYGIYDLAGNVSELCTDGEPGGKSTYLRQGGSWSSDSREEFVLHKVIPIREDEKNAFTGFRCVISGTFQLP